MNELRFRFWVTCILGMQMLLLVFLLGYIWHAENNRLHETQQLTELMEKNFIEVSRAIALNQSMASNQGMSPVPNTTIQSAPANSEGVAINQAATTAAPVLTEEQLEEQEQNYSNSDAIISSSIAVGTWTEKDTRALIPHLANLSYEQRIALLEKFHSAVNRQELNLESFPPL